MWWQPGLLCQDPIISDRNNHVCVDIAGSWLRYHCREAAEVEARGQESVLGYGKPLTPARSVLAGPQPSSPRPAAEVLTYWHLRRLVRRMRSFRQVSYWPGPFGPYGGLVTFEVIVTFRAR